MSESRLNIELFKKIRDRIATIPESYEQSVYYSPSKSAPCGTVCCIAGEAIICNEPDAAKGVEALRYAMHNSDIPEVAARLLGLLSEADGGYFVQPANSAPRRLFTEFPQNDWPEPFGSQWRSARRNRRARAKVAVAYLDHIIETGKVLE